MNDVLVRGQFTQPTGAAGMKFVGRNTNLGSQTKHAAVIESCARVDHHRRTIDQRGERVGGSQVVGDDRVGVMRSVTIDVLGRLLDRIDHRDADDRAKVLGRPIVFGRRQRVIDPLRRPIIGSHLDPMLAQVARQSPAAPARRSLREPTAIRRHCRRPSAGIWRSR